ncbi:hypothetical protein [Microbacterium sp. Leaf161]|uniref:hypothetical protein n=1 Tax=Microbacterium sp. Leaf161 TaxID=1736281 RepID=UPI0012FC6CC7|nr:hypothetical protein [Microbacterium sp. Leaf161]
MHTAQFMANCLSTITCAQMAGDRDCRRVPDHDVVHHVEGIVDLSQRASVPRDMWLASTAGLTNPLMNDQRAAEWIYTVAELLMDASDSAGTSAPIVLAGNPLHLRAMRSLPRRIELRPLSHKDTLTTLNRAIGCLTPPGLTTVLESLAYDTPVLFLPEQHYGHHANYARITGVDGPSEVFPDALVGTRKMRVASADAMAETKELGALLRECSMNRGAMWDDMVDSLARGMRSAMRGEDLVSRQQQELQRLAGGIDGVHQVVDAVETVLTARHRFAGVGAQSTLSAVSYI